jgi:hypothetical protein
MPYPICGMAESVISASDTPVLASDKPVSVPKSLSATVLLVKRYPCEEFGILLHSTGAVVTIRDVKIFVPESHLSQGPASGLLCGSRDTREIEEGTQLVLNDVGVWNVNTTALHHARVTIGDKKDLGLGCASDGNTGTTANYRGSTHNNNGGTSRNNMHNNFNNGQLNNRGQGNRDTNNTNYNGYNNFNQGGQGQFNNNNFNQGDQRQFNSNNHNNQNFVSHNGGQYNSNANNYNDRSRDGQERNGSLGDQLPRHRKQRTSMM